MSKSIYRYLWELYIDKLINIHDKAKLDEVLKTRGILNSDEANKMIYEAIISGKPFFVGRIGGSEFSIMKDYLISKHLCGFSIIRKKLINQINTCAGFFPPKPSQVKHFAKIMIESTEQVDLLARWWGGFENYIIDKYAKKSLLTDLRSIEPWQNGVSLPWTAALEGKKVLIIHPFEQTIIEQYKIHDKIFPNTKILPKFDLKTLKAVQTIAGQTDERFESWFEALDYMYLEAMKIDFDVAIIGCGAYGFPLAAKLKEAGKQAIHLGGATQILFGIKGKRWEGPLFTYVQAYYNDFWKYPNQLEKPKNAEKIEGGCYW